VIPFLVGMMPGRAVLILGAFVLILGSSFGAGYYVSSNKWQAKYAKAESRWQHEQAAAADAARFALETWTKQKAEAEAKYVQDIQARDSRIAALARTADGLRNAADKRAIGGPDDSLAACRADAAALVSVLTEVDREAGDLAKAADQHADEVRVLLDAWPK
jgi:hypothetical protein